MDIHTSTYSYIHYRNGCLPRGSCAGQAVLELGAGPGVVGLMLAELGAQVTLTDIDPRVLDLLRLNVRKSDLLFGFHVVY